MYILKFRNSRQQNIHQKSKGKDQGHLTAYVPKAFCLCGSQILYFYLETEDSYEHGLKRKQCSPKRLSSCIDQQKSNHCLNGACNDFRHLRFLYEHSQKNDHSYDKHRLIKDVVDQVH